MILQFYGTMRNTGFAMPEAFRTTVEVLGHVSPRLPDMAATRNNSLLREWLRSSGAVRARYCTSSRLVPRCAPVLTARDHIADKTVDITNRFLRALGTPP